MSNTVLLIHGAWLTADVWAPWQAHFEALGYRTLAPAWPLLERAADALRHSPGEAFGRLTLGRIADLEPVPRGVYCGAVGWVDADRRRGDLNVAIRTFWVEDGELCLGTGGGITWDSDPDDEWAETELKARQLLRVASGSWDG